MADDHLHQEDLAGQVPSDPALRIKALESLLVELGLVDPATIDAWIESFEKRIGPHNGAKIVARAWVDPDYKQRLLANGAGAIGEMNLLGSQGQHIVVVENTPIVHNLVVCTCAHAIRGRCSGCHRAGTNRRRIDRGPS
jgi:nitrile hydratase subunit alpha